MKPGTTKLLDRRLTGYVAAALGVSLVTAILAPWHDGLSSTTVALALLLVVLFVATGWGSSPALVASVLGVVSFNFFFLPPVHTFTITQPQNWVALAAFLLTALTAGQLSARARQRTEEAESGRREVERLYRELQSAFERESHAEALRQAERLKSALLDGVTHDLRTPLTSIKASVTTLLGEASEDKTTLDPDGQRELLEVIDEEADRLNRGVEKLVELAKIEAGEMHVRRRWSDVEEIVAAALTQASRLTPAHTVEVRLEPEIPAVFVDAQAIAEVIYTLVDNATKYAPPGTRIKITQTHPADDMIELAVEDEGPGISTELRTRVFEKFFRATNDSRIPGQRPTGLGLGLAVARGIIEAHGGRIWIEEGSGGHGTRVAFRIPIGDDDTA